MHIVSSFNYSMYVEMAVTELEQFGIPKESIVAVPLEKRASKRQLIDSIHYTDGGSLLDAGVALAAAFTVVGASMGYIISWGPIICGLIAAAAGFTIGLISDILIHRRKRGRKQRNRNEKSIDMFLLVHCSNAQSEQVESILWDNLAEGVARLN